MRSLRARFVLVGFMALTGCAVAVFSWNIRQRDTVLADEQRNLLARLEGLTTLTDTIDAGRLAYLDGSSSGEREWLPRVRTLLQQLSDGVAATGSVARSTAAVDALPTITDAAAALQRVDATAAQQRRAPDGVLSSDLVAEGRDILDSIRLELRTLRAAEAAAYEEERAALRDQSMAALGVTAIVWLSGFLLLAREGRHQSARPAAPVEDGPEAASPAADAAVEPQPPRRATDLEMTARVCQALSRLPTADALPEILARAAGPLRASGAVVWVQVGDQLVPASAHGYDRGQLERWGALSRDADNVTAQAWRTGELQAAPGSVDARAALAAPMLDPEGCFGVLTTEVQVGMEDDAALRALTMIVAAQLAAAVHSRPAPAVASTDLPLQASGT